MIGLLNYINEAVGKGISDEALLYRLGKYKYEWKNSATQENIKKKYHLSSNFRKGIINWMRDVSAPFLDPKDEVIPRSQWDLDAFQGTSVDILDHPHNKKLIDYIFKNHEKKHNILVILQCSNSKPYIENRVFKTFNPYEEFADFVFACECGIVPPKFSNYYPCRYTEWNHMEESEDEAKALCDREKRLTLKFKKEFGYDKVIILMQNEDQQGFYRDMFDNNEEGSKDWMKILIDDNYRKELADGKFDGNKGLAITRLLLAVETKKKLERELRKHLDGEELERFNKVVKELDEKRKERE